MMLRATDKLLGQGPRQLRDWARPGLERLVKADPQDALYPYWLGRIYTRLGDRKNAETALAAFRGKPPGTTAIGLLPSSRRGIAAQNYPVVCLALQTEPNSPDPTLVRKVFASVWKEREEMSDPSEKPQSEMEATETKEWLESLDYVLDAAARSVSGVFCAN